MDQLCSDIKVSLKTTQSLLLEVSSLENSERVKVFYTCNLGSLWVFNSRVGKRPTSVQGPSQGCGEFQIPQGMITFTDKDMQQEGMWKTAVVELQFSFKNICLS